MITGLILGIEVPDEGPLFMAALGVHVLSGMTCVVAGAVAATARKQPGRHPRAGRVYCAGIAVVFASATVLAVTRWSHDWYLFVVGLLAFTAACAGYTHRRLQRPGWTRRHLAGMSVSYIALLTAFYVDVGPQLPVWNRLPIWALWLIPSTVGTPITARALWIRDGPLTR